MWVDSFGMCRLVAYVEVFVGSFAHTSHAVVVLGVLLVVVLGCFVLWSSAVFGALLLVEFCLLGRYAFLGLFHLVRWTRRHFVT